MLEGYSSEYLYLAAVKFVKQVGHLWRCSAVELAAKQARQAARQPGSAQNMQPIVNVSSART